jgi:hypothetical protein
MEADAGAAACRDARAAAAGHAGWVADGHTGWVAAGGTQEAHQRGLIESNLVVTAKLSKVQGLGFRT